MIGTPNCWDSWSKFMKSSAGNWVLYSFCWLPIVGSFLLIYGHPFWTFIHSLLTNRPIVHVFRISGPSLSWSIFQFLGSGQPYNLVIVVVIVVVSQIIINYNLKSIIRLYHIYVYMYMLQGVIRLPLCLSLCLLHWRFLRLCWFYDSPIWKKW